MAKELPYFKFDCAQWISGRITLEDLKVQGVFVNICAFYWFKSGSLKLSEIKRRVKCKQAIFDRLVDGEFIKVEEDVIKISFLDEQFEERGHISKINSENGKKGGAPKGNLNAKNEEKNNRTVNEEQPKTTNIEVEENKNKKENNMSTSVDGRIKNEFEKSILGIIQSIKSEFEHKPIKEYKINPKRIRMVAKRKKEFHAAWGVDRDFFKACQFAFRYKAKEWFGKEVWQHFIPETLLSDKFVSYLEKAEQDKGEPYTGEPKKKEEEKVQYTIPK